MKRYESHFGTARFQKLKTEASHNLVSLGYLTSNMAFELLDYIAELEEMIQKGSVTTQPMEKDSEIPTKTQ